MQFQAKYKKKKKKKMGNKLAHRKTPRKWIFFFRIFVHGSFYGVENIFSLLTLKREAH